MFAKNKVSQSLVDAVNSVVNGAEKVTTSEGWDDMLKSVKDKNKPQPSGGAGKKQGSRYGGSKQKEEPQEKEVKEELKGNQHKIDKNKNNKIDAEDFKMLRKEELKGDQHKIDVNHNNKIDGQDFKILRGKKKVKEDTFAGKLLNSLSESEEIRKAINEVMKRDASAGDWISDFLHSDNPKFDGKSKAERKKMALAAYYSMKKRSRNESVEDLEMTKTSDEAQDTAARKSIKAKDTEKSQKIDNFDSKYGKPNEFSEEVEELNEISKSEVDHHYDKWTTSSDAPNHHDAGDDDKIHKSALKYLRGTKEPKENHEKIAMYIANKFHGSGIDEAAPKKMDDVAKQNLTPAKKGVVGTVKSDFKNFKNFLAGKKETNEAVDSNKQTIDTLAGRSKKVPKEAKIDHGHSSAKVELKSEEVEQLDEDRWLMRYLLSRGINPQFVSRNQKVAHAKSNEFKKYRRDHQQMQGEEVQSEATSPIFRPKPTDYNSAVKQRTRRNTGLPFAGPYTKVSADPMQRARSMAQSAMQSVKDKQNQPTTMDKVKSAVDKTKRVATKTFMTAFKP